jgi:hypothetical protein
MSDTLHVTAALDATLQLKGTNTVQNKHPFPRGDSNPRSQQALGHRPTP